MSIQYKYIFLILLLVLVTVWLAVLTLPTQKLRIIACDVGQGDAILATLGKSQILIDGGQGRRVLDCLSKHIPFWDRTIEVVVLTHPQKDHYGGLIDVFQRYNVGLFVANPLDTVSEDYKVLKTAVGGKGVRLLEPKTGQSIRLGLMHLDIVFPTISFSTENLKCDMEKRKESILSGCTYPADHNDFSVVAHLRYKNFDALFTGDIGPAVIDEIIATGRIRDIEYLKVPHHGSKNGLTEGLLLATRPEVAVISSGAKNSYGHPHKEVIDLLNKYSVKIYRTDESGDVVAESDGKVWKIRDKKSFNIGELINSVF